MYIMLYSLTLKNKLARNHKGAVIIPPDIFNLISKQEKKLQVNNIGTFERKYNEFNIHSARGSS